MKRSDQQIQSSPARMGRARWILPPCLLLLIICAIPLEAAWGGAPRREHPLPATVNVELSYLLKFVGARRADPMSFDPQRIAHVLGFVVADKPAEMLYVAAPHKDTAAAYLEVDVRRSLTDVLRIAYDPELPASLSAPSTVRTAHWIGVDGKSLKALWETPMGSQAQLHVVGTEHLVNTPDAHTGAYYAYDLDRTLLRMPHRNDAVVISLSAQRGRSDVGLQGLILGPDEHWNYLYTDRRGLRWPGLGWVESYMYDSYSAAIFLPVETAPTTTRFAMFKWLRAGWAGLNVVSSQHILDGLDRFGRAFKKVVENPRTANIDALSRALAVWKLRSTDELRQVVARYLADLSVRFPGSVDSDAHDDPNYLTSLTRDDLIAIVQLEQIKASLGMSSALQQSSTLKTGGRTRP